MPKSTFYDLVNKGKIIPLKNPKGCYKLNDSLKRLGLKPTATSGYDATTWSYDSQRGWITYKEYPDGQDSGTARDPGPSYTYTAAGRLKTRTWGGGKHTRYDYRRGLLVAKRHFLAAADDTGTNAGNDPQTPDVGMTYNNRGQLTNIVTSATSAHPGTLIAYTYNGTNFRRTRETPDIDPDLTFTLQAADLAITIDVGSAVPASISRSLVRKADTYLRFTGTNLRETTSSTSTLYIDSTLSYGSTDGRLLSVAGNFVGSARTYTYAYQANSNADLIDTVTVTGSSQTVDNQWLGDRDALDWKENRVGTATVSKYDYSVNAIGQRDAVTATSTVGTFATAPDWSWLYNPRGELVSSQHLNTVASSRHYTYDGIGNRSEHRDGTHTSSGGTAKAYTPNAINQYDAVGTLSPSYDLDGNMTSGPLPAVPTANSALVWDGENQLIEVTPSGGSVVKYHYDALGRRIARTIGSTSTYWFYDGWNLIAEFTGDVHTTGTAPALTLEKTWLWGTDLSGSLQGAGGVGGLLASNRETGTNAGIYNPLYDGNGNICQYLNSSGTAVAKYEYDGFGNTLVSTGSLASAFPHRFSTKPLDAETGLYYYGYRYYDPLTGRWPSRDPIEEQGGINLYGFVGNAAIGKIDVFGAMEYPPHDDIPGNPEESKRIEQVNKTEKDLSNRRSKSKCCTQDKIDAGKKEMDKKFKEYEDTLTREGKVAKGTYWGEVDGASCYEQNTPIAGVLNPVPECWECKLVNANAYWPTGLDHWWIECKAYIDGRVVSTFNYDSYHHNRKGGKNPQDNRKNYPYESKVSSSDYLRYNFTHMPNRCP